MRQKKALLNLPTREALIIMVEHLHNYVVLGSNFTIQEENYCLYNLHKIEKDLRKETMSKEKYKKWEEANKL